MADLKLIPYGISNFKQLRLENKIIVGISKYIRLLEEGACFLFFVHPYRFGNSDADGCIIRFYDIVKNADPICEMIGIKDLRMKMGKAAIKSSERFSDNLIMPQSVNLFEELYIHNYNKLLYGLV